MPYEQGLPFGGIASHSRHASFQGARDAKRRAASQTARYLELLREHPEGLTDHEAAKLMGLERSSINARRVPLVVRELVFSAGFRKGPTGIRNTIWKAR